MTEPINGTPAGTGQLRLPGGMATRLMPLFDERVGFHDDAASIENSRIELARAVQRAGARGPSTSVAEIAPRSADPRRELFESLGRIGQLERELETRQRAGLGVAR